MASESILNEFAAFLNQKNEAAKRQRVATETPAPVSTEALFQQLMLQLQQSSNQTVPSPQQQQPTPSPVQTPQVPAQTPTSTRKRDMTALLSHLKEIQALSSSYNSDTIKELSRQAWAETMDGAAPDDLFNEVTPKKNVKPPTEQQKQTPPAQSSTPPEKDEQKAQSPPPQASQPQPPQTSQSQQFSLTSQQIEQMMQTLSASQK